MYDYANILFSGPCNLGCYECIGNEIDGVQSNLHQFPLINIDGLLSKVNEHDIPDLAFTGTNTDPQLYNFERELIDYIKPVLTGRTKLSLHTNGLMALRKMDLFNMYDKASVSLHSFKADTYENMTRAGNMPDISRIAEQATIPLKLSMLVTEHNIDEIDEYVRKTADLGISRVVVRKIKGREDLFPLEEIKPFNDQYVIKKVYNWPVYEIHGVEVTVCGFDKSTAKGLFLFSDGSLEEQLV
jgi:molybdenum cofactor biosynthesis enzyme MoaA